MKELNAIDNVINESIRRYNAQVERFIRDYMWKHKQTRLHIELVTTEPKIATCDGATFLLRQDSDRYEMRLYGEVGIRQKLPIGWRPQLPD